MRNKHFYTLYYHIEKYYHILFTVLYFGVALSMILVYRGIDLGARYTIKLVYKLCPRNTIYYITKGKTNGGLLYTIFSIRQY